MAQGGRHLRFNHSQFTQVAQSKYPNSILNFVYLYLRIELLDYFYGNFWDIARGVIYLGGEVR